MSKIAIIVLADSETPEGRGRMAHAMTTAKELRDSDNEVRLLFEGIGVTWLKAFHLAEHPFVQNYAPLFEEVKDNIMGACHFCTAGRFDVAEHVEALNIPLLTEESTHFSVGSLVNEGYQIITF
jgi:hypothetical protein